MNLNNAIAYKQADIEAMSRCRTACREAGAEWNDKHQAWAREKLVQLDYEIAEIQRYQTEGGPLNLSQCKWDDTRRCLLAHIQFSACIMRPENCGFAHTPKKESDGTDVP